MPPASKGPRSRNKTRRGGARVAGGPTGGKGGQGRLPTSQATASAQGLQPGFGPLPETCPVPPALTAQAAPLPYEARLPPLQKAFLFSESPCRPRALSGPCGSPPRHHRVFPPRALLPSSLPRPPSSLGRGLPGCPRGAAGESGGSRPAPGRVHQSFTPACLPTGSGTNSSPPRAGRAGARQGRSQGRSRRPDSLPFRAEGSGLRG